MSPAALVLVHGRSQQMPPSARRGPAEVSAFVAGRKRRWLAGLARGLVLAGLPAVDERRVRFPYYANAFVDAIAEHRAAGGGRPDLELDAPPGTPTGDALILDAAQCLGYDPGQELAVEDPASAAAAEEAWRRYHDDAEADFGPLLRPKILRSALQFVARKTGAAELLVETVLTDVGYYLDVPRLRAVVLDVVTAEVRRAAEEHGEVVLVAHSLGSIVAYDVLSTLGGSVPVRLLVTTGSPLGYPVVQDNLLPATGRGRRRPVPRAAGGPVPWLNAYDVRDIVALVHPMAGRYDGQVRDERVHNPSDPHAIQDYLADPDVARPIGRALSGQAPW